MGQQPLESVSHADAERQRFVQRLLKRQTRPGLSNLAQPTAMAARYLKMLPVSPLAERLTRWRDALSEGKAEGAPTVYVQAGAAAPQSGQDSAADALARRSVATPQATPTSRSSVSASPLVRPVVQRKVATGTAAPTVTQHPGGPDTPLASPQRGLSSTQVTRHTDKATTLRKPPLRHGGPVLQRKATPVAASADVIAASPAVHDSTAARTTLAAARSRDASAEQRARAVATDMFASAAAAPGEVALPVVAASVARGTLQSADQTTPAANLVVSPANAQRPTVDALAGQPTKLGTSSVRPVVGGPAHSARTPAAAWVAGALPLATAPRSARPSQGNSPAGIATARMDVSAAITTTQAQGLVKPTMAHAQRPHAEREEVGRTAPTSVNIDSIVAKVEQRFARRLAIESERRGKTRWR